MFLADALVLTQPLTQIESIESRSPQGDRLLYVIRHGESALNVLDPDSGLMLTSGKGLTIPLTQKGKDQASRLGNELLGRIKEGSEIVICSSTALRAQQTAHEIFHILNEKNRCELDINYDGLCELGQGKWEGLPKDAKYKEEINKWEERSAFDKIIHPKIITGESFQDVTDRLLPDLQTIVQKYPSKIILVVSHHAAMNAMAIKVNRPELSKEPKSKLPLLELENCDMVVMKLPQDGTINDARIVTHISCGLEN